MNTYTFRVTPTVDVEIDADSKREACVGLNQRLAEYFRASTKRMTKEEAKLIDVLRDGYCWICKKPQDDDGRCGCTNKDAW
jgi:hypothetical protein